MSSSTPRKSPGACDTSGIIDEDNGPLKSYFDPARSYGYNITFSAYSRESFPTRNFSLECVAVTYIIHPPNLQYESFDWPRGSINIYKKVYADGTGAITSIFLVSAVHIYMYVHCISLIVLPKPISARHCLYKSNSCLSCI